MITQLFYVDMDFLIGDNLAMSKIFCSMPYYYSIINGNGDVYLCCDDWCNYYSIGNVLTDDFDAIFNGEKIQKFLEQFKNQKFEYCNLNKCTTAKQVSDEEYNKLLGEWGSNKSRILRLTYDIRCNLQCIFCRSEFNPNQKYDIEFAERMDKAIRKFLPKLNENGCNISINGAGEFFVSPLYRQLIKDIVKSYPNITFSLITNGILCSKEMLQELGIEDKIKEIEVSVHAYTEKTYNKLVNGGNFNKVKENLNYLSDLYKQKKIKQLFMNFTVTSENYKEMLKFTKWAFSLGAVPIFLNLINMPRVDVKVFNKLNIVDKNHLKYNDFVKTMKKLIPYKDRISIPEYYFALSENKENTILKRIFHK